MDRKPACAHGRELLEFLTESLKLAFWGNIGMTSSLDRRGFLRSAAPTGSLLVCYGVLDRSALAAPVRIVPPVVDSLTIQVILDTNHDIFISGAQAPGV